MKPIEERKEAFKMRVWEAIGKTFDVYSKQMLADFSDYWTELNKRGTKMRFENEKYFDPVRRLATWKRNADTRFGRSPKLEHKIKRRFPSYYDREYEKRLSDQEKQYYWQHLYKNGWRKIHNGVSGTVWKEVAR